MNKKEAGSQEPEAASPNPDSSFNLHPSSLPRIWPAVVIALLHLAAAYVLSRLASTNVQSAIALGLPPLVATLLLIIWWLAASRVPVLDRLAGLVLFIAGLTLVVFTQKSKGIGAMLLVFALPAMTLGIVAVLAATYRLRWPARRWVLVAFMVACTAVFCAKRVDSVGGDLAPVVSWRWNPTPEERSEAVTAPESHATATLPAKAAPDDWPGFRGPARDNRVIGMKFSTNWSTPPREIWRRKIGGGWSSFAAVGDYIFTQEQRGEEELVTCYKAATGDEVWANRVKARFEDSMGLGPRATPAFFEGRLYTQGGTGTLQCLDAATGNTVWKRDLTADANTKVPGYGFSSSPLVVENLVIAFSCGGEGKSVVAYNRASGEVAWRAGHGGENYPSPQLAIIGQVPQLLMTGSFGLQAFAPETGALLWEYAWKAKYPRCVQPLVVDNAPGAGGLIMIGTTTPLGSRLLHVEKVESVPGSSPLPGASHPKPVTRLAPGRGELPGNEDKNTSWTVEEKWTSKGYRPYFNDGVLHKGYCYGFDGDRLVCIDIKTGERRWEGKRYGGQVILFADMDTLLVLSEKGDVVLVQATPERFNETARFHALTGKTWNHPVAAHGKLFVRNSDEAACFDLPAAS